MVNLYVGLAQACLYSVPLLAIICECSHVISLINAEKYGRSVGVMLHAERVCTTKE